MFLFSRVIDIYVLTLFRYVENSCYHVWHHCLTLLFARCHLPGALKILRGSDLQTMLLPTFAFAGGPFTERITLLLIKLACVKWRWETTLYAKSCLKWSVWHHCLTVLFARCHLQSYVVQIFKPCNSKLLFLQVDPFSDRIALLLIKHPCLKERWE